MSLLTPRRVAWSCALVCAAGIVAVASYPTGAPAAVAVVPPGARVGAQQSIGAARVFAVMYKGRVRAEVAYHDDKGWYGLLLDAPPARDAAVAWTATRGRGPVPALSAVYGHAPDLTAKSVVVAWRDGRSTRAAVTDGIYVAARTGAQRARAVRFVDAEGSVLAEVPAP